jgi:soluble lytic murein transglycosylase-like protein
MKVYELILTEEQQLIREFNLKHAVAAAGIGAALMGNPNKTQIEPTQQIQQRPAPAVVLPAPKPQASPEEQKMAQMIATKYSVEPDDALEIVRLAHKYAKPNFPKAKDLLAIIGIESSFDPEAVSGLRRDPAVGLTQVRPKVWGIDPESLKDPETAIKTSSDILHLYYRKLKDRQSAVAAYNVGMSEFRNGNNAEGYVSKFTHELKQYTGI